MLNIASNKTKKPVTTASSGLPGPQQSAIAMRTTRGHAAKRDTNGKLVYSLLCMYVHVHVIKDHTYADSKKGQMSGSPDVPESQEVIASKSGKLL